MKLNLKCDEACPNTHTHTHIHTGTHKQALISGEKGGWGRRRHGIYTRDGPLQINIAKNIFRSMQSNFPPSFFLYAQKCVCCFFFYFLLLSFGRIFGVTHTQTCRGKKKRNLKLATANHFAPLPLAPRPTPSTSFSAAGDAFLIAATEAWSPPL